MGNDPLKGTPLTPLEKSLLHIRIVIHIVIARREQARRSLKLGVGHHPRLSQRRAVRLSVCMCGEAIECPLMRENG